MNGVKEVDFEAHIESWLVDSGGYVQGDPATFDPVLGLDVGVLAGFVASTQPKTWAMLVKRAGGEAKAATTLAKRVAKECDKRGTVDVLRHGVHEGTVGRDDIRVAYFKPAHGLTPALLARYEANRLTVVRQLAFESDSNKTLDLALLVNGIPVATAELKNPLTGQNVQHAIRQYRNDRDPKNTTLADRAVVHFAVDPYEVAMTTRLAGQRTRFLPFNMGNQGGKGNPPGDGKHPTAYLWENVWQRDAWLDLLNRFVHVETPDTGSKAVKKAASVTIFPRYHQWDAVLRLEADAKANGAGHNYLVQHSAGSGKSNSIAWLAHRLSNLHDAHDNKVFDKVVVITDRRILDRQLQATIFQFEHVHGVVERIDKDSKQLAEALEGEQAKIVITTLQKFPFVLDMVKDMPDRKYALIVDEAHSSQGGQAAKDLREALGTGDDDEDTVTGEDLVVAEVAGRGRQANLSFFAFTATPKAKTLELFGTKVEHPDGDRYEPFHLYSMRQAIEEKFILDVLANYATYDTFFHIEKAVTDDPEYDPSKAKAAIARYLTLHPDNLAQRSQIIVDHFEAHTAAKIRGHAKAMVVTSSRKHAVKMAQALRTYVKDHDLDVGVLVAFSGTVKVNGGEYTEANMNGFPEAETARRFDTDDYRIMVVAEKFQTGFDQPLLHSMYVDKPLTGLATVQTLSRLNRIHPSKKDTFVLDFRNDTGAIRDAFAPYYERTAAIPTDPNRMWETKAEVAEYPVIYEIDIPKVVDALRTDRSSAHEAVTAGVQPAVTRYNELSDEDKDGFRDVLKRFLSVYGFMSLVVDYTDQKLDDWYVYGRALDAVLPRTDGGCSIDLSSQVQLSHLAIEQASEGDISLPTGGGEVVTVFPGEGPQHDPEKESLSDIIAQINERFHFDFTEQDRILLDQYEAEWMADGHLADQAVNNDLENFMLVFSKLFMSTIVSRMDANEDIFKKILDQDGFHDFLLSYYGEKVYQGLRREGDG